MSASPRYYLNFYRVRSSPAQRRRVRLRVEFEERKICGMLGVVILEQTRDRYVGRSIVDSYHLERKILIENDLMIRSG